MAVLYDSRRSFETIRKSCTEKGRRDVVWTVVETRRGRNGLGRYGLRSGGGSHLCRNRQRWSMAGRTAAVQRQRQPVCVLDPCRQARHGRIEMVLPADSRRFLGL